MAQVTAQASKSKAITLKGSAELVGEFFSKYNIIKHYPMYFILWNN